MVMRNAWWIVCVGCSGAPAAQSPAPAAHGISIVSAPELVVPGIVSTEQSEVRLAASPDGNTLLWGSTDRKGGPGGWDIWRTQRGAAGWSVAVPVSFDSEANDFDPAFSTDGRWVYFFSNRPGGAGGDDIYRVAVAPDGSFGPAQHLGAEINTAGDEWAPAPSPDGTQLMFATNQPGGKHDLVIARAVGDGFAPATPLPGAINTPDADELDATFLPDGRSIIFSRSIDIQQEPPALYFTWLDGGSATALPAPVNVPHGFAMGPSIAGDTLYFSAVRPPPVPRAMHIYRVRFTVAP